MLNDDGNRKGKKKSIGLISKEQQRQLFACSTLFVHCFAAVVATRIFLVTYFKEKMSSCTQKFCCLCSCSLFFSLPSFSTFWPLAFLIFSPPVQNFYVLPTKFVSLAFYLSQSSSLSLLFLLSFAGLSPTFSFSLSFSFSIFQICGLDN